MRRFDERTAECRVFTFKEGALSALAHDLELRVTHFHVEVGDDLSITASFDATSLVVLHALDKGRATRALSEADKKKIARTAADEVLRARQHPEIHFRSAPATPAGEGYHLRGTLTLCGRSRPLELFTRREGGRQLTEATLLQPDFGIVPYRALLGTLRLRPEVKILVALPWPDSV